MAIERAPEQAVTQAVVDAFSDVQYPGDDQIVTRSDHPDLERIAIARDFQGRRWEDLSTEFLLHQESALFFMTRSAFRYFLPAYLRAAVLDLERSDIIPANLVFLATAAHSRSQDLLESLSPQQTESVIRVLEWLRNQGSGEVSPGDLRTAIEGLRMRLERSRHLRR